MTKYKIQSGDTLTGIAKKYNTTVDAIANANGIKNKNLIYTGDTLNIPISGGEGYVTESNDLPVSANKVEGEKVSAKKAADSIVKWQSARPKEKESFGDDINALLSEISGMDFSYDPSKDAAYKLIRDEVRRAGRIAMEDTLGKALSMTGGYGNSYAQGAAQEAYAGELSRAVEYIPELYEAAYGRFSDDRDAALEELELLSDLSDAELDKYNTLMKLYLSEGDMLFENYKDLSDAEFDRFLDYAELLLKQSELEKKYL